MALLESDIKSAGIMKSMQDIKNVINMHGENRESLAKVLEILIDLAGMKSYWPEADYPASELPERQARYLITQDPDQAYTLYMNVFRPGKPIPPHNHTTWACIAAVSGTEHNYLYRRVDDGSIPGRGLLEQVDEILVSPGTGVALMPEDIHRVAITGDAPIRHLHLYGRALETLSERVMYDLDSGEVRRMGVGVSSRQHTRIA